MVAAEFAVRTELELAFDRRRILVAVLDAATGAHATGPQRTCMGM